ncbi:uncharacterized protein LOC105688761 [Athalia rosae]|uniref:uncharacterized protein LOC105688761 n=1 Tax=Athalia rosae TaxID=37344 RepID=UPI002034375D|nr:uncharacterized protein LOC105688761 [Athalia rosae]
MDILLLIGFLGLELFWGPCLAHLSVLPPSKDISHGTQYRFQYFVRDERGDYKTQEEAGEGGNARGSYAVEEPDGNLRIVQYTADLGGGFKAHIKVDHAGKSPSKLQEIDIPAEEMRKLIEKNRKKSEGMQEILEAQSSKSYVLGPPRRMSDIVMEQAAAIREIISKELEAEEKLEAEERLKKENVEEPSQSNAGRDEVDCGKVEVHNKSQIIEDDASSHSPNGTTLGNNLEKTSTEQTLTSPSNTRGRTAKSRKVEKENAGVEVLNSALELLRNSQILNKYSASPKIAKNNQPLNGNEQSPVVRVALNPKNLENSRSFQQNPSVAGLQSSQNHPGRDFHTVTSNLESTGPPSGGPVQNFSFRNRIMFYKPAERKSNPTEDPSIPQEIPEDSEGVQKPNVLRLVSLGKDVQNYSEDKTNQEQIVIYSPYQQSDGQLENRKSRYITVPYEVLRPYLTSLHEQKEEISK